MKSGGSFLCLFDEEMVSMFTGEKNPVMYFFRRDAFGNLTEIRSEIVSLSRPASIHCSRLRDTLWEEEAWS